MNFGVAAVWSDVSSMQPSRSIGVDNVSFELLVTVRAYSVGFALNPVFSLCVRGRGDWVCALCFQARASLIAAMFG